MRRVINAIVVVLVVAVAGGLLLGLITRSQQAAHATQCVNNLRLVVIGLEAYHDWRGTFPAALMDNPALPPGRRLSWLFELDPYVHARMDPNWTRYAKQAWDSDDNLALARERMPWYVCPAAPTGTDPTGLVLTSYVGATGVGRDAAELPAGHARAGVFGYDRRVGRKDITDGATETIAVLETTAGNGPWTAGGWATARGLDPAEAPYLGPGRPFGGTHPGRIAALFADGSVRFLTMAADPATIEALVTTAAGDRPGRFTED